MNFDIEIFGKKKFSDLLKDIYDNQKKKSGQINTLIADLKQYITNIDSASTLVPIIKDYMEVSVKNDEHLVKLAAVIQRMINNKSSDGSDGFLTDEEKDNLLREIKEIGTEIENNKINDENVGSTKNHIKRE